MGAAQRVIGICQFTVVTMVVLSAMARRSLVNPWSPFADVINIPTLQSKMFLFSCLIWQPNEAART
jgi:hypothetical protein